MWFWFALAAALISGLSVTFNKRILNRGVHSSVLSFFLFFFCTLVGLFFLIKNQTGGVEDYLFFVAAGVSALVFSISKTLQLNIFKKNNLSEIYPLASLSPLILYLFGLLTLNETIRATALAGLVVMIAGVYLINYRSENRDLLQPLKHLFKHQSSLLYLFALVLSSISAIAEKIAINHTIGNNIFYLAFWENVFLTCFSGAYVIKTNRNWLKEIRAHIFSLIIAGSIFTLTYFLVLLGFKEGPVALISAIKKVEVLVVLILSNIFFLERPSKYVYIGAFLMLIAVVLIKI